MSAFDASGPPVVVLDMDEVLYMQLETFFGVMGQYYVDYKLAKPDEAAQMARQGFLTGPHYCSVTYLANTAKLGAAWLAEYYPIICKACNAEILKRLTPDAELLEYMDALHQAGVVFALLTHNYRTHAMRVREQMGLTPYLAEHLVMGDECLGKQRRKYTPAGYLALDERLPKRGLRIMHDDQPRNLLPLAQLTEHGWNAGVLIGTADMPEGLASTRHSRIHDSLAAIRHEMGA